MSKKNQNISNSNFVNSFSQQNFTPNIQQIADPFRVTSPQNPFSFNPNQQSNLQPTPAFQSNQQQPFFLQNQQQPIFIQNQLNPNSIKHQELNPKSIQQQPNPFFYPQQPNFFPFNNSAQINSDTNILCQNQVPQPFSIDYSHQNLLDLNLLDLNFILQKYKIERLIEDLIFSQPKESEVPKNKEIMPINFEKDLKLQIEAPYQYYKLNKLNSQVIPLKISLDLQSESQNFEKDLTHRPSVDLICVVDISGSMCGEKLNLVKKTLIYIMSILTDQDRMALIIFDDLGEKLITLKKINEKNQTMFKEIIENLKDRNGTIINSGLKIALQMINERKTRNEITSIFLLSDGVDNIGQKALNVIEKTIKDAHIEENYTINSFGFGKDHDAHLMREIAKSQGGNFYFIDNLNTIDECFVDAIGMLFSVVLKDIELSVKVNNCDYFSDMRIKKTYGDIWKIENNEYKIKLKVFTMGMKKDFICEINIPPFKKLLADEGKHRLVLMVELNGKSIKDQLVTKLSDLYINFFNPDEKIQTKNPLNIDVILNHMRVKGAENIEIAKKFADQGKFTNAQQELEEIKIELEECICRDNPALVILRTDIENSKKLCQNNNYNNAGKSNLISFANNNMYQQSCPSSTIGNINNIYANPMQKQMNQNLMMSKKSKY